MSVEGTAGQLEWVRDRGAPRRYLIEIDAYNIDTPGNEKWYFASEPFVDADGDTYRPILVGDVVLAQRLPESFLGGAVSSGGSFVVDNSTGDLDALLTDTYCLCGRALTIYGIDPSDSAQDNKVDYLKLFVGWTEDVERLSDNSIKWSFTQYGEAANRDVFVHGVAAELPRTIISYGRVLNAEGYLDDQTLLKYYVGGVDVQAISAVYISGVSQTDGGDNANEAALDAASVTAGTYQTCEALGLFRLGSTPDGQVTFDLWGEPSPTALSNATGIVGYIGQPSIPGGSRGPHLSLNTTSWNALVTSAPQKLGFHIRGPINISDAVNLVTESVGAVWWYDNAGEIQVEVFSTPFNSVGIIVEEFDILGDVHVNMVPPIWRYELSGGKNHTVQSGEGLPSSITQERREELAKAYFKEYISEDTTIEANYPSSHIVVRDTLMNELTDVTTEANRLMTTHKGPRRRYKLRVFGRPCGFGIYETWTLLHDRISPVGVDLRIVAVSDHLIERFTDLELWG